MKLAMIGLGRMGGNMAKRMMAGGHEIVAFDQSPDAVKTLEKAGAQGLANLQDIKTKLQKPRVVWSMLPAGEITEQTVLKLAEILEEGDLIIDGGNSYFKDDVRRAEMLKSKGIRYMDAGVSGGVWGLERGYCLMVGGPSESYKLVEPILKTLAPGMGTGEKTPGRKADSSKTAELGYLYCGPIGSGHFVKMIHNGIEYGMMQSFAEGFDILKNANSKDLPKNHQYDLDLGEISELWRRGSVVSSWLLDLLASALAQNGTLSEFKGYVNDSGEGRWTIQAALEAAVPANVLTASLYTRFRSRQDSSFAEKVLSAMRAGFGGHKETK